jgi:hypothetical protein
MAHRVYTDSRYTFTSPDRNRKYIQYLREIEAFNMKGIQPTRKEVQVSLGDPDPTKPTPWVLEHPEEAAEYNYSKRSNWGNSRWAAMGMAGLIRSKRDPHGNTVRYQITGDGVMLLHSVL